MKIPEALAFACTRRTSRLVAIALAVAALAGLPLTRAGNRTHMPPAANFVGLGVLPPTVRAVNSSAQPRVEVLSIQLRRHGFAPGEITRPAGDYLLSVSNMSGVPNVVLQLDREGRQRLKKVRVTRDRPRWHENVRLQPGVYLLTEADHPSWVCRITITAQ